MRYLGHWYPKRDVAKAFRLGHTIETIGPLSPTRDGAVTLLGIASDDVLHYGLPVVPVVVTLSERNVVSHVEILESVRVANGYAVYKDNKMVLEVETLDELLLGIQEKLKIGRRAYLRAAAPIDAASQTAKLVKREARQKALGELEEALVEAKGETEEVREKISRELEDAERVKAQTSPSTDERLLANERIRLAKLKERELRKLEEACEELAGQNDLLTRKAGESRKRTPTPPQVAPVRRPIEPAPAYLAEDDGYDDEEVETSPREEAHRPGTAKRVRWETPSVGTYDFPEPPVKKVRWETPSVGTYDFPSADMTPMEEEILRETGKPPKRARVPRRKRGDSDDGQLSLGLRTPTAQADAPRSERPRPSEAPAAPRRRRAPQRPEQPSGELPPLVVSSGRRPSLTIDPSPLHDEELPDE